MRITNQMKPPGDQTKVTEGKASKVSLKAGSVIRAQIVEVMTDGLILALSDGKLLRASNEAGRSFQQGQVLDFEVLESGEKILVRPHDGQAEADVKAVLTQQGIPESAENKAAASALIKADLPVNSATIQQLKTAVAHAGKLADLASSGMVDLDKASEEATIKDLLVSTYSKSPQATGSGRALIEGLARLYVKEGETTGQANQAPQPQTSSSATSQSAQPAQAAGQKPVLSPGTDVKQSTVQAEQVQRGQWKELAKGGYETAKADRATESTSGASAQVTSEGAKTDQAIKGLIRLLGSMDFEKLAFAQKAGVGSQLSQLIQLEKAIYGEHKLGDQLRGVMEQVEQLPKEIAQNLLETALAVLEEPDHDRAEQKLQEQMDKVLKDLPTQDKQGLQDIQKDLSAYKDASSFLKQVQSELTYVQVPIYRDGESHTLEVYMKKRRATDEEDAFKIFLSLDTHNISTVQAIVDKQKDQIRIEFRLESEAVRRKFETNISDLRTALKARGVEQPILQTKLRKQKPFLPEVVSETADVQSRFDVRV